MPPLSFTLPRSMQECRDLSPLARCKATADESCASAVRASCPQVARSKEWPVRLFRNGTALAPAARIASRSHGARSGSDCGPGVTVPTVSGIVWNPSSLHQHIPRKISLTRSHACHCVSDPLGYRDTSLHGFYPMTGGQVTVKLLPSADNLRIVQQGPGVCR